MKRSELTENWRKARQYTPEQLERAKTVLEEVRAGIRLDRALRANPMPDGALIAKHILVAAYRELVAEGEWPEDPVFLARIRMKPVRTLSGVTTVTVLTKAAPCPGECIFCPTEYQMPKSYLADEPGAARAFQNRFDPYDQVNSRIREYEAVGHPNDKIELLVLGGSWSCYPRAYQEWFIRRCFNAMNDPASYGSGEDGTEPAKEMNASPIDLGKLQQAHQVNEHAPVCPLPVAMVVSANVLGGTRPFDASTTTVGTDGMTLSNWFISASWTICVRQVGSANSISGAVVPPPRVGAAITAGAAPVATTAPARPFSRAMSASTRSCLAVG